MSVTVEETTGQAAIRNLGELHHLPPVEWVLETRADGHPVLNVAVTEQTAEDWRKALALLDPFVDHPRPNYTTRKTTGLWMGATVHLQYATY